MELLKFIIYSISFVIGVQISKGDLKLLKGKIEYKLRLSNYVAYLCALLGFVLIGVDIYQWNVTVYWCSYAFIWSCYSGNMDNIEYK